MFVLHKDLNGPSLATAFLRRGEERKWQHLAEEEFPMGTEIAITAYGIPLSPVTSLKCLGNVLLTAGNNWPAVVQKLWRERQKWERLCRVLSREGLDACTVGIIYVSMVQAVIIYGL